MIWGRMFDSYRNCPRQFFFGKHNGPEPQDPVWKITETTVIPPAKQRVQIGIYINNKKRGHVILTGQQQVLTQAKQEIVQ